ncbi:HNH endonuclease signature motif containing protein [Meiothermus sp.]|uniref:HNH endonuclease signature motif containing protein n=1 Tax=Meiothermus sp. TaxID=1955249 RepID=UPI0035B503D3
MPRAKASTAGESRLIRNNSSVSTAQDCTFLRHTGGQNTLDNRMLVHRRCHLARHQRVRYKSLRA